MLAHSDSLIAVAVPGWETLPTATDPYTIGLVPGEGIGPSVIDAAHTVLQAVIDVFDLDFDVRVAHSAGEHGAPGRTLDDSTREFFDALFALDAPALCGPVSGRFVYELRAHYVLYCKLVPVRPLAVLADASIVRPERLGATDILIVRDNMGGLYQGQFGRRNGGSIAFQEAVYDTGQVDRLLTVAFRAAAARRGRLAVVTKPGGIPAVSDLWRERAQAMATSSIALEEIEVDNACFQLVADPQRFDVVAAPNLLGDIVADTAALVLGSRGMALSANFGEPGRAVYQTGHGAAYDLAGTDRANPIAQIQALALLLRESLGLGHAAAAVEQAITSTLGSGLRTPDIAGPTSTVVGTRALADAVAERVTSRSLTSGTP